MEIIADEYGEKRIRFASVDELCTYLKTNATGTVIKAQLVHRPKVIEPVDGIDHYGMDFHLDMMVETDSSLTLTAIAEKKSALQAELTALTAKETSLKTAVLAPVTKG